MTGFSSTDVLCVVGARPNFVKMAPLLRALHAQDIHCQLVHTGQHQSHALSTTFFESLAIPEPDFYLSVDSQKGISQSTAIMMRFEQLLQLCNPRSILVVGDVTSTLACALCAAQCQIPVIHVEAGLRSFDRTMPEEINRIVTDQLSSLLFTTEISANRNLAREGISAEKIFFTGNVMVDSLRQNQAQAIPAAQTLHHFDIPSPLEPYALATLHRPSNVDHPKTLLQLITTLHAISHRLRVVMILHPRTEAHLHEWALMSYLTHADSLYVLPAQDYLAMLGLQMAAHIILTDSGGIQEESTVLEIPCLTMRHNTERPATVEVGSNTLVGTEQTQTLTLVDSILNGSYKQASLPEKWDGHASERIAEHIKTWLNLQCT